MIQEGYTKLLSMIKDCRETRKFVKDKLCMKKTISKTRSIIRNQSLLHSIKNPLSY